MTALEALALLVAGLAAGTINAVIGAGTLVTFPALLAIGLPPVVANVTNGVGLAPGSFAAVVGYRRELRGRWRPALGLALFSAVGAVTGSLLLLWLPVEWFRVAAPVLIAAALVLVVLQPRVRAWVEARRPRGAEPGAAPDDLGRLRPGAGLRTGIGLAGIYGGYFGAAQGVLLFALLGTALSDDLQRVNGLRNLYAGIANGVSAAIFVLLFGPAFAAAAAIAVGATAGGVLGARIGRRLSPRALRAVVVVVGLLAIAQLVL